MKRDWSRARAKVDASPFCRVCGTTARRIEAAHVIGREHDAAPPAAGTIERDGGTLFIPGEVRWKPYRVHPDRVVPLCGPATDTTTCHGKQHARRLDLLPYLTVTEQVQAVADAGGIAQAYDALAPSESHRRVRGADRAPMPGDAVDTMSESNRGDA